MFFSSRKSVTLVELIVAIVLLSVMILGINSINVFSHFQLANADRRVKVQNDVSRCLEHISKYLSKTIGNEASLGADSAIYTNPGSTILAGLIDTNGNGVSEATAGLDKWASHTFDSNAHTLTYCNQCSGATGPSCSGVCAGTSEVLANDITAFSAAKNFSQGNYVVISLTGCWQPGSSIACGNPENPSATMSSSVPLPSVSTN